MSEPTDPTTAKIRPDWPLLIVDVDEVLGLFMHGFGRFVAERGYEMRIDRFALFQNIYKTGETECIDTATGRALFDDFFRIGCELMDVAPHAVDALNRIAEHSNIVVLTNAPDHAREPRARWLVHHGIDYPLIINEGPKGAAVKALAARTEKPAAFVDDLLHNLDSAAEIAPDVHRFQHVADERLRQYAPASPLHRRIDDWPTLGLELDAVLRAAPAA
jgi:hypothetical protein